MTNIDKFIKEFVVKAKEVTELVKKYGVEDKVEMGMFASSIDESDPAHPKVKVATTFNVVDIENFEDSLAAVLTLAEESELPEEGTIDWWMQNFGNDQELN